MFAVMTGILAVFITYNANTENQMQTEQARAQEQITLSKIDVNDQLKIISVTVNNTGSIEVKIRAIYVSNNGVATFLDPTSPDPSSYMSTYIAPAKSLTIPIISGEIFDPQSKIIAATERGTKTIDSEFSLLLGPENPPQNYDPGDLYAGPLKLAFNAFYYQDCNDQSGTWNSGGAIPHGTKCAWKITITNVGNRAITLYKTSSFTTVSSGSSDSRTWFIDAAPRDLPVNGTADLIFKWYDPEKQHNNSNLETIFSQTNVNCMIFLTFFGYYHDSQNTPYAQTVPFVATKTT